MSHELASKHDKLAPRNESIVKSDIIDVLRIHGGIKHYPEALFEEYGEEFLEERWLPCLKIAVERIIKGEIEKPVRKAYVWSNPHYYPEEHKPTDHTIDDIVESLIHDPDFLFYLKNTLEYGDGGYDLLNQYIQLLGKDNKIVRLVTSHNKLKEFKFLESGQLYFEGNVDRIIPGGTIHVKGNVGEIFQGRGGIVYVDGNVHTVREARGIIIVSGKIHSYTQDFRTGGGLNMEAVPNPFIFSSGTPIDGNPRRSKEERDSRSHHYYEQLMGSDDFWSTVHVKRNVLKDWHPTEVKEKSLLLSREFVKAHMAKLLDSVDSMSTGQLRDFMQLLVFGYKEGFSTGSYGRS